MKRLLAYAIVPWMVMAATASSQIREAHVSYTYFGELSSPAYRLADECFLPIGALDQIGWHMTKTDEGLDVDAEGGHFKLPLRTIDGRDCIPLGLAMDEMGGITRWNKEDGDRFYVYSKITSMSLVHNQLQVSASLKVKAAVICAGYPTRLVVDILGSKLVSSGNYSLDSNGRLGQFGPDDVRVVWQNDGAVLPAQPAPTQSLILNLVGQTTSPETAAATPPATNPLANQSGPPPALNPGDPASGGGAVPLDQGPLPLAPPSSPLPQTPTQPAGSQGPATVNPPRVASETSDALTLSMTVNGTLSAVPSLVHEDATDVEIVFPGGTMTLPPAFALASQSILAANETQQGADAVVTIQMARPMEPHLIEAGDEVRLLLLKPNVGNGSLTGKTIVVDAGHGGSDTGCDYNGEFYEKNFTLQIAKLVQADLQEAGANVLMTRTDDSYPSLNARSALANDNKADFFISIHINSNELMPNNRSGTTTYYHGGNDFDQILARCIQQEVVKVSGLPSLGIVNDYKLHPGKGLAVLRNTHSNIPSVLIEVGYINNATDLKSLMTPSFQENVAMGIVNGFKVYLGNAQAK